MTGTLTAPTASALLDASEPTWTQPAVPMTTYSSVTCVTSSTGRRPTPADDTLSRVAELLFAGDDWELEDDETA